MGGYNALALAVDLGLNYYDEERDLSIGATFQSIGSQVKSYDNRVRAHVPFNLALGLSKGFDHLPVRLHITLPDLTHWKSSYYILPEEADEGKSNKVSFSKIALNHLVVGLDILPTDYLYLSVGYNFRRAYELKASGSSALAGLSAGAGVNIKKFNFGLSYARYSRASGSIGFNAGYSF